MLKLNCSYTIKNIGVYVKVNKIWILIILVCLFFSIYGHYNQNYFFLFVGIVGACAGIICMLCEMLIQILRNQKKKNKF